MLSDWPVPKFARAVIFTMCSGHERSSLWAGEDDNMRRSREGLFAFSSIAMLPSLILLALELTTYGPVRINCVLFGTYFVDGQRVYEIKRVEAARLILN